MLGQKFVNTIAVVALCWLSNANAAPELNQVVHGAVAVEQHSNQTVVHQTSQHGIVEWQKFNVAAHEKVHFNQPHNGVTLNRINPTHGASTIAGTLSATGRVIIVNAAGIHFSPTAIVNVGSLIASTADISNRNFLANQLKFDIPSPYNAEIINEGSIIADHGLVALMANSVTNNGHIQSQLGNIVLASGDKFTLSFHHDQLLNFVIDEEVPLGKQYRHGVKNTGKLLAPGGQILVHAKAAAHVLDKAINMQGVAQANSVRQHKGNIILEANQHGNVKVAAPLDVSGKSHRASAGDIKITGGNVTIKKSTKLIADSYEKAGNVSITAAKKLILQTKEVDLSSRLPTVRSQGQLVLIAPEIRVSSKSPLRTSDTVSTISLNLIQPILEQGHVHLLASEGDITMTGKLTWNTPHTLTLAASRNIDLMSVNIGNDAHGQLVLASDYYQRQAGQINFLGATSKINLPNGELITYDNQPFTKNTQDYFSEHANVSTLKAVNFSHNPHLLHTDLSDNAHVAVDGVVEIPLSDADYSSFDEADITTHSNSNLVVNNHIATPLQSDFVQVTHNDASQLSKLSLADFVTIENNMPIDASTLHQSILSEGAIDQRDNSSSHTMPHAENKLHASQENSVAMLPLHNSDSDYLSLSDFIRVENNVSITASLVGFSDIQTNVLKSHHSGASGNLFKTNSSVSPLHDAVFVAKTPSSNVNTAIKSAELFRTTALRPHLPLLHSMKTGAMVGAAITSPAQLHLTICNDTAECKLYEDS